MKNKIIGIRIESIFRFLLIQLEKKMEGHYQKSGIFFRKSEIFFRFFPKIKNIIFEKLNLERKYDIIFKRFEFFQFLIKKKIGKGKKIEK